MLTMINENAEGEFGGVMFLYAATPDFRSDVIQNYQALNDRIGSIAFIPGRPMTPLIDLHSLNSDQVISDIGKNLVAVFVKAYDLDWDESIHSQNIDSLVQALKRKFYYQSVPPRDFVYHFCRLLEAQRYQERLLSVDEAEEFVGSHELHDTEEDA